MGGGKSPLTTDTFILESDAGISYVCPIINTSSESFTVRLADGCETGYYKVFVKRDTRKKSFGRIYINIVEDIGFEPDAGTTVYGIVSSAGVGVKNVVVSDGAEVTVTNEEGIYQLKSAKKWGYVFISVPSGYEVPCDGVLPQFHRALKNSPSVVERADFKLEKVDGQDSYKIFMLGDMHLANRTNDLRQFAEFTSDLTDYMTRHKGEKMYALTLGDMTWDLYWYSNSYYFPQYLNTINSQVKDLPIFHTMGNHDNDFKTTSDYDAAVKYVDQICPTYYSFNLGEVHYVVLDNFVYVNTGGREGAIGKLDYEVRVDQRQLEWLKADLGTVADRSAPLVVVMHAQLHWWQRSGNGVAWKYAFTRDADQLVSTLTGFREVHLVTGHSHMNFRLLNGNLREHNIAATSGTWWWTGQIHGDCAINTCLDGSPGGYEVFEVDGRDIRWHYKGIGLEDGCQFRAYDMNEVLKNERIRSSGDFTAEGTAGGMNDAYGENDILVNIWGWQPDWTVCVTENGRELRGVRVIGKDPLHKITYTRSTKPFQTAYNPHMWRYRASGPSTTVRIEVTDSFGRTSAETMTRPKAFHIRMR